jgi:hypothetical protein
MQDGACGSLCVRRGEHEMWKQQRSTRRNLTLRNLVELLRNFRIDAVADLLKKQDGGTLFAYNTSDEDDERAGNTSSSSSGGTSSRTSLPSRRPLTHVANS